MSKINTDANLRLTPDLHSMYDNDNTTNKNYSENSNDILNNNSSSKLWDNEDETDFTSESEVEIKDEEDDNKEDYNERGELLGNLIKIDKTKKEVLKAYCNLNIQEEGNLKRVFQRGKLSSPDDSVSGQSLGHFPEEIEAHSKKLIKVRPRASGGVGPRSKPSSAPVGRCKTTQLTPRLTTSAKLRSLSPTEPIKGNEEIKAQSLGREKSHLLKTDYIYGRKPTKTDQNAPTKARRNFEMNEEENFEKKTNLLKTSPIERKRDYMGKTSYFLVIIDTLFWAYVALARAYISIYQK